jgi:hypothetical protein
LFPPSFQGLLRHPEDLAQLLGSDGLQGVVHLARAAFLRRGERPS